MRPACGLFTGLLLGLYPALLPAYPLDGYADTGIRRLQGAAMIQSGEVHGRMQPEGATLPTRAVDLRLLDRPDLEIPASDPDFTAEIVALLGDEADRYSISVLDLSDPGHPLYAEHNGNIPRNPGSVGKLVVGTGLFQALADAYPDDLAARRRVLHDTRVIADDFIIHDHHKVRFWNPVARTLTRRPLKLGDEGSLWEYLDWMLSASSNAAASTVIEQAMLLGRLQRDYPLAPAASGTFFRESKKSELRQLLVETLQAPLTRNGIDLKALRQGSFFTAMGKRKVPGTSSYATSRELMQWLLRLEQGRIVDAFSSRELKRLLYMTERRIRYASSPALRRSAVYFKSGSLYQCKQEPGFKCYKYHGNVRNLMNSVAIVEDPAVERRLYYIVTLTSNVLRKNSAVAHQTLATRIHRLLERRHGLGKRD